MAHGIYDKLWQVFNKIPEGPFKMNIRLWLAATRILPHFITKMSPIRASTFKHMPQPGDVVVDGGAFPGDFTIFASKKVGAEGRVLTFEPNPQNFEMLKSHVERIGLSNVLLLNKGLWSSNCQMKMAAEGVDAHLTSKGTVPVQLVTLDSELQRLAIDHVDFIKMDIEGAEVEALKGATGILRRHPAKLAVGSYHEHEGVPTKEGVAQILKELGYSFVNDYPHRPNTYAWKESSEAARTQKKC